MFALSSLSSVLGNRSLDSKTSCVAIEELNESDNNAGHPILRFQYFPESITDSKEVNWTPKDIPGGSLPLYQWISSGARTLSFQAVFTTDVDFSAEALNQAEALALWGRLQASGEQGRNVDSRAAVLWLRRFMMPRYGSATQTGTPLTTAPRKLRLHIPGSGIGLAHGGLSRVHDGHDFITAIMTGCQVQWVQFFPSGFPRIVEVSLSFAQVAQFQGAVYFPSPKDDDEDKLVYDSSLEPSVFSYKLPATNVNQSNTLKKI
jgi:hypothetical protein